MCAFCFCSTLLHVRCPVVVVFVWLRVYFRCCNSAYRTQVVVCVYLYLSFVYLLTVAVLSLNLRTHSHSRILITFFLPFDFRWNTRRKRVLVYKLWSDRWDRIYLVSFCFVVQLNGSSQFFFAIQSVSYRDCLFFFVGLMEQLVCHICTICKCSAWSGCFRVIKPQELCSTLCINFFLEREIMIEWRWESPLRH